MASVLKGVSFAKALGQGLPADWTLEVAGSIWQL